jgi:colanic acid biosynthesis glycosyl transferase WcaI
VRALIVGSSYAPEETGIAPYTSGLAEHLAGRGHQVVVVTAMPSYPQWRVHADYRGRWRVRELRGGVEVRRVRAYVSCRQSLLRRGLHEASFLLGAVAALAMPRPDVVVGVVPALSGGVVARVAARRFQVPYGLIFQDLTGPAANQSGVGNGARAAGPIAAAEGWTARGASAIGIVAEGFRRYLVSLGVEAGRIRRVRNWTHVEEPRLGRATVRQRLDLPRDAMICLHAGNMGLKQGLSNVVECARLAVQADPRLLFLLMGDGSQRPALVDLAQRYRLPNLRFLPIQPAKLFSSVLAAADVLLVNQRAAVTNMSLPGKLTSYFASGRPVVAAVSPDSETAAEIRDSGAGVLAAPDQPGALLEAVGQLIADPARQKALGTAGREYARTTLSRKQALADLESLVNAIASTSHLPRQRPVLARVETPGQEAELLRREPPCAG